ncbi:hypothetical protein CAY94_27545 [Pseudomonas aeruginosa]|nr:hypothetical protein CAY94_27545 [Pseudomonas aeruginosa]
MCLAYVCIDRLYHLVSTLSLRRQRQLCISGRVMFESLARCAGRNLLAGLLTGMGKDGARGLLAIRSSGSTSSAAPSSTASRGMP